MDTVARLSMEPAGHDGTVGGARRASDTTRNAAPRDLHAACTRPNNGGNA